MRRVDHHHVNASVDQCLAALKPRIAHSGGRRHPQPPHLILAGLRVQNRFLGVLQRQKPGQLARPIGDQKLLDPPRLHQADRRVPVHRLTQERQILRGHHHRNRGLVVRGKAHVAVGDDAHHAALTVDHRKAGDLIAFHQGLGIGQRLIGGQRDGGIDHAGFKPLDAPHLARLGLQVQVAVNDPDPTGLGHGNRHAALGDRVHRARQKRDVHADGFCDEGRGIGIRGQHARCSRNQQDVVKGKRLANLQLGLHGVWLGSVRLTPPLFTGQPQAQERFAPLAADCAGCIDARNDRGTGRCGSQSSKTRP